jgi:transcriptional regulator with XRE-family HTH domain
MRARKGRSGAPPMSPLNRRFAENLILLRARSDLSQQQTAERSGLHQTEISLLERGLRLPRLDTIVKLGGAVEAEPCEFLAGMAWRLGRNVARPGAYLHQGAIEIGTVDQSGPS